MVTWSMHPYFLQLNHKLNETYNWHWQRLKEMLIFVTTNGFEEQLNQECFFIDLKLYYK